MKALLFIPSVCVCALCCTTQTRTFHPPPISRFLLASLCLRASVTRCVKLLELPSVPAACPNGLPVWACTCSGPRLGAGAVHGPASGPDPDHAQLREVPHVHLRGELDLRQVLHTEPAVCRVRCVCGSCWPCLCACEAHHGVCCVYVCVAAGYPVPSSQRVSCTNCGSVAHKQHWNAFVGKIKSCPWCHAAQTPVF